MTVCAKCRREMVCVKTGVDAVFGDTHCYRGDAFECPECKARVLRCNVNPYYNPDALKGEPGKFIKMED